MHRAKKVGIQGCTDHMQKGKNQALQDFVAARKSLATRIQVQANLGLRRRFHALAEIARYEKDQERVKKDLDTSGLAIAERSQEQHCLQLTGRTPIKMFPRSAKVSQPYQSNVKAVKAPIQQSLRRRLLIPGNSHLVKAEASQR